MQYAFGSGTIWGVRSDVVTATPQKLGVLQDGSVEFSATQKELFGGSQFPVASARGTGKITGKSKFAAIDVNAYGDLFFGAAAAAGSMKVVNSEKHTIPATSTYIATVTNSAHWVDDLGVANAANGLPYTRVAAADTPTEGQYSVAAGVYTFAAADEDVDVYISYTWKDTTAGHILTIDNQLLGVMPQFKLYLNVNYSTGAALLVLNACTSSKLSFATKLEDWLIPEFDFGAFADSGGHIGYISTNA